MQILIAALHLIGLALGMYGVLSRATALREPATAASLKRAFTSDTFWGVAALILIGTGLYRLLGGIDKGTLYYMKNPLFHAKLTCIVVILALEVSPMMTLLRARAALAKGIAPGEILPPAAAKRIWLFSHVQATLLIVIIFLAVAMARGYGVRS
jgi:putative membrane protein